MRRRGWPEPSKGAFCCNPAFRSRPGLLLMSNATASWAPHHRIRRPGAGDLRRHDAGRHGRRGLQADAQRIGRARRVRSGGRFRAASGSRGRACEPEESGRSGAHPGADRRRGCGDRGLSARGDRAAGVRAAGDADAKPRPGVRSRHGLGPEGTAGANRGPRPELHRPVGRAARHGRCGPAARAAAESDRRLWRRGDDAGGRRAGGLDRGPDGRAGAGWSMRR